MSYTALYRKYRPRTFDDVVGQDIIVTILKNAIINNKISHAYLFNGPRGTGKTSIAKIFAKVVNCESTSDGNACGKCDACINLETNDVDIIEIDAASNNGVEEIREIRSKVKLMPTISRYKVYIIDEVHMLSIGAFNALLKTLEEPPEHVIFILATTEINKIPLTILSRCLRFDFAKITNESLVARLKYICEKESKSFPDNIYETIAELSDGGCRDAINLLDQVLSLNKEEITVKDIYDINGAIEESVILDLFRSICTNNIASGLKIVDTLVDEGKNLSYVVDRLLILIRNISINSVVADYFDNEKASLYREFDLPIDNLKKISETLIELNIQLSKSSNQKNLFEIYYIFLTELVNNSVKKEEVINTQKETVNSKELSNNNKKEVKEDINIDNDIIKQNLDEEVGDFNTTISNIDELTKIRVNNVLAGANKEELKKILKDFDRINDFISNKVYNNIAALLLDSKVVVASSSYLLFTFSDESLISVFNSNIRKIEDFVSDIFENKYLVVAVTESEWTKIRNKFVEDRSKNITYKLIPEEEVIENGKDLTKLEDMAINVFGEEIVESK